jgi:type VI protein secretion system component Hcp
MAKGDHSDLFMIFKDASNAPIPGQSMSVLSSSDPVSQILLDGFKPGYMFEIDKFTLSAECDDESPEDIKKQIVRDQTKSKSALKGAKSTRQLTDTEINRQVADRVNKQKGPPVKEISFTRSVDASSASFLQNIAIGKGYRSASLIKRKATGGQAAAKDDKEALAGDVYLRIDFDYVLITEVEWDDDDDEVTEDCKFICRKISIQYRPQLPDGTLGAVIPGVWEWKPPTQ